MSKISSRIINFLWFDNQAVEAVDFYVKIFPNSRILSISKYGKQGHEIHKKTEGSVMTVTFELDGIKFIALNGGPIFKFNEAISFMVNCENQIEIDHFWNSLSDGGEEGKCGWLKDKFGISWQIIPKNINELLNNNDFEKSQNAVKKLMSMKKINIDELINFKN